MGEAKRRGTYDQRKDEGEAKRLAEEKELEAFRSARAETMRRRGKSKLPLLIALAAAMRIDV